VLFSGLQVKQHQLVPFAEVAQVGEITSVGGEFGLESGRGGAAVQKMDFRTGFAAIIQQREHQARAVPGHVGMVPFHPGGCIAVRAPGGLHIKIRARGNNSRPAAPVQTDDSQNIALFIRMDEQDAAMLRG